MDKTNGLVITVNICNLNNKKNIFSPCGAQLITSPENIIKFFVIILYIHVEEENGHKNE